MMGVKKAARACDACKRRKGKCYYDENPPCKWCTTNNIKCEFLSTTQKRGPKTKKIKTEEIPNQLTLTINKRELGMCNELELGKYLEAYLKSVDPLYTRYCRGDRFVSILSPRTPAQHIIKYTACAMVARLTGQRERSNSLISEARALANKAFDDITADGMVAFLLLGSYWTGGNPLLSIHFLNTAVSMFNLLGGPEIPPSISQLMTICSVFGNVGTNDTYLHKSRAIENHTNSQVLVSAITRLRVKIFSHIKYYEADCMRLDVVAVLFSRVVYSEAQRVNMLEDINTMKNILPLCDDFTSDVKLYESVKMLLRIFETIVQWRSGNIKLALPIAIAIANELTSDPVSFVTPTRRFDVEQLLMISIFLYEQHQPTLSEKLLKLAESYAILLCDSFPPFNSSTDDIIKYTNSTPFCSYQSPSSSATIDTMMSTMVNNVISLISQLTPIDLEKYLLPAQGLHMLYKTLSTFLPLDISPFDTQNDQPFTPILSLSIPDTTTPTNIITNTNLPISSSSSSFFSSSSPSSSTSSPSSSSPSSAISSPTQFVYNFQEATTNIQYHPSQTQSSSSLSPSTFLSSHTIYSPPSISNVEDSEKPIMNQSSNDPIQFTLNGTDLSWLEECLSN